MKSLILLETTLFIIPFLLWLGVLSSVYIVAVFVFGFITEGTVDLTNLALMGSDFN